MRACVHAYIKITDGRALRQIQPVSTLPVPIKYSVIWGYLNAKATVKTGLVA